MFRSILPAAILAFCFPIAAPASEEGPGLEIYRTQCASCHGDKGQGSEDGYDEPLYGDHSVKALARYIEKAMPEDDPESCVGDDARSVAQHIYDSFYSLKARQRNGLIPTPRVELTRLTVSQYRNVVADIIAHFTPEPKAEIESDGRRRRRKQGNSDAPDAPRAGVGLRGEYFQSKGMSKANDKKLTRLDHRIDFDFGEGAPIDDISADQFAIVWQGSLVANTTGYYEFRVSTQNGARLYVNRDTIERRSRLRDDSSVAGQAALIDEWVSSGKMRQPTARVYLLGGRRYPFRLEFFKYKEPTASIKLEWKPLNETWSVIDQRFLRAELAPRTFVVDTPFPADDRSLGYERGNSISREWHVATSNAAVDAAEEVIARLPFLTKIKEDSENRAERLKDFVNRFATVAFRRPLSAVESSIIQTAPYGDAPNLDTGTRRALMMVLNSPQFLYTELIAEDEPPSQHLVAARLAMALWDSIPDQQLVDAANSGQLSTREQVLEQAHRMLANPRARAKMREFFHHWLEIEERDLSKDKQLFPEFNETVIADLRYSLETFVEEVVWSDSSDYRQLLQSNELILNHRLASLYQPNAASDSGISDDEFLWKTISAIIDETAKPEVPTESDAPTIDDAQFAAVEFPADRRAGVLTHPYLLSAFAYHNNTSPIHRGVFLTRNIVGRELKPPPVAVAFKDDEFDPTLTMREKITELTRDTACISCHSVINPLGFTLENFDAVGRWRTKDNDKPIKTESEYTTRDGQTITVTNARDVAKFAVASDAAHQAFVGQLFHHLIKQDPAAFGVDTLNQLRTSFANDDYNIQNLMARIAVTAAIRGLDLEGE